MMVLDDSIEGVNIVLTKSNSITFGTGLVACKIYPDVFRGLLGRPVWVETKLLPPSPRSQLGDIWKEWLQPIIPRWRLFGNFREAHLRPRLVRAVKTFNAIEFLEVSDLTPEC
jgi:hypothetical protein